MKLTSIKVPILDIYLIQPIWFLNYRNLYVYSFLKDKKEMYMQPGYVIYIHKKNEIDRINGFEEVRK